MSRQPLKKMSKDVIKAYKGCCEHGMMTYSYGCNPGECKFYVYRIVVTEPDGSLRELSWPEVKDRCVTLGINHVQDLQESILAGSTERLEALVGQLSEGSSLYSDRHIREGVVVRVESEYATDFYKAKSFDFGMAEGYLKDDSSYVDEEEAS